MSRLMVALRLLLVSFCIGTSASVVTMSRGTAKLRVVSYNVLSSHLASPSYYTTLQPEHLDATARLTKVISKLEGEISTATKSNRLVVFCLQEVSYDWAGALHTFFAQRNYHVVTGLYGKKFNGYMGVLTAYPSNELETISVDICRLADTVETWPVEPAESMLTRWIRAIMLPPLKYLGLYKEAPESHWSIAQRRANVLVTSVLKEKQTNQVFAVGNYHMPCCFYAPMVMVLHCDMCLSRVQRVAHTAGADVPYILAGDFNMQPDTAPYLLLTTGQIDMGDPINYPSAPMYAPDHKWQPTILRPVLSAYAAILGKEPDFTNYGRAKEDEAFIGTLDYIFVSDGTTVKNVLPLPHRDDANVNGPFPNEVEPSDHVLIAADLDVASLT
jgi:2',5'-phosphodiesterase